MTTLTLEVKDADTKLWIPLPQIEALGMKGKNLVLRGTFPLGSLYGDGMLRTQKARLRRNGKAIFVHRFHTLCVRCNADVFTFNVEYSPTKKESKRLKKMKLPEYTGHVHGKAVDS